MVMKRYLTLFAMAALLLAACKPEELPDNSGNNGNDKEPEVLAPELLLTSSPTMEFEAEGGNANILFVIKNPAEGEIVTAECEAEWVTDLTAEAKKVTFSVQPNETESERTTKIVVSYQELSFEVSVSQKGLEPEPEPEPEPEVIEVTGAFLTGTYYGNEYSDAYNYYVVVGDKDLTSEGDFPTGSSFFAFDLYSTVSAEDGATCVVPAGEYAFDAASSCTAGTFSDSYSYALFIDDSGAETEVAITAGNVAISENKLEATVTIEGDKTYHIVYEGALEIVGSGGGDGLSVSTLTEDLTISSENGLLLGEFYGDYYEMGMDNYMLSLYADSETFSGHAFMFEVLTEPGAGLAGTYSSMYSTGDAPYYIPGDYEVEGGYLSPYFSWYMSVTEGGMDGNNYAPLVDGNLTISINEDGTYTIVIDMYDDLGHKVSGTITAEASILDEEGNPLSTMQKSRSKGHRPTNIKKAQKSIKAPLTFKSK